MPKVQRPQKKKEGLAAIRVDGETYVFSAREVTASDASDFRQATKLSVRQAMELMASEDDVDIDLVAGVVFLARRQRGERNVKFSTVAKEISYDSDIEAVDVDAEEVDLPQR